MMLSMFSEIVSFSGPDHIYNSFKHGHKIIKCDGIRGMGDLW